MSFHDGETEARLEFEQVVRRRRMVRRYQDRPVPRDVLLRILDTGRRAPSAGFSQGHTFVVVTAEAGRRAIAALAEEDVYLAKGYEPWLSSAPVHVVLCADGDAYKRRYASADKAGSVDPKEWPVPYPMVDAGASLMLLLLGTVNEGLAAGFLGAHRLDGIGALLSLPPTVIPVGLVTIGYPAPDRASSSVAVGRRPLGEVVHWERWDDPQP